MATPGLLEKKTTESPGVTVTVTEIPAGEPDDAGDAPLVDDHADEADKALAALGYQPVFKREFSQFASFSFALSISGIYGSLMSTWVYGLKAGGASAILWSWVLGGAGAWALAASIAEIASAYPTSGAMYTALKYLAPEAQVPLMAWLCGYLNLIGCVAGTASTEYANAQMLLAAISMATEMAYKPTQFHMTAVAALLVVLHAIVNTLPSSWLSKLTKSYAVFHMGILIAACVCLLVFTKNKHTVQYTFTDFTSTSGWSPPGFAFLFGCLTPSWIMTNADSAVRIAEEAKNPARVVPSAIIGASTFTYIVGLIFNIILIFCMGDINSLLHTPLGQPVAQLFLNSMGLPLAIFFTLGGFVIMNLAAIAGLQASSRTVFSYARDDLIPLSRVWRRISRRSTTPLAAVWVMAGLIIFVNLVSLVSQTAINAIFNVCTIAYNLSSLVPLVCKILYGKFQPGPFHLGRWSLPLNIWAVAWNLFMTVVFLLPTELPATAENMNYAPVVFIASLIFSLGFWIVKGRYNYTGPR
ncbi:amino acid transporter [Thozetella sp. PMI_491]|nr:amino acid transporter [Thozetella sp. PMI_491]